MKLFLITILLLYSSVLCGTARLKSGTVFIDTPSIKQVQQFWRFVPLEGVLLSRALGKFDGYATIAELMREQAVLGASVDDIERDGGSIAKRLVALIPTDFAPQGFKIVVDVMVFSLVLDDRPIFPDYEGNPRTDFHLPTDTMHGEELMPYLTADGYFSTEWHRKVGNAESMQKLRELWMSVASHRDGVSHTQFLPVALPYVKHQSRLIDGEILLASSLNPRYELRAINRGLRLMMRVRLVPEHDNTPYRPISQQYLHAPAIKVGQ